MTVLESEAAGDEVVWIPSRTDLAVPGTGIVEFRLMCGETLGKKAPIFVSIRNAPTENPEEPDEETADWITDMVHIIEGAKDDAEAAVDMAERAKSETEDFWQTTQPISILDVIERWNYYI